MKIGYTALNWTIGCSRAKTFRLKSYSHERVIETAKNNLDCLLTMLKFNLKNDLLFFRITSRLIPFASHPIMDFNWKDYFKDEFKQISNFIHENDIRISMHPGQFVVVNTKDLEVFERGVNELKYHVKVLDLLKLDSTSKMQVHVGGVYGDKEKSMERFIERYKGLNKDIKRRLVIENDEKSYNISECLEISEATKIPVLFDYFHHEINNDGNELHGCFENFTKTWKKKDGLPLVDYSSQKPDRPNGTHIESIDLDHFRMFLKETKNFDFDIMLEIKDKETSALKAVKVLKDDPRFNQ
ncbi:UV DNA damage repair endonuclease UvsE [Methanobacterium sp. ACI-7]|uniref:UV DNA damage repair endonuclease UvsE n=1 Tax=unclassified Methanobacterium TaxID=2627676 RepID=UPI0039C2308D